jgi:hypothetical protein
VVSIENGLAKIELSAQKLDGSVTAKGTAELALELP